MGPKAAADFSLIKLIAQAALFFVFVYVCLTLPLVKWVWIEETSLTAFQLIAFSTTVLSLPLMGFAYWTGDVRTVLQAQEATMSIIPAVLLSALIYHKTRNPVRWALALSSMVFFSVCFVNEILGPFRNYVYLLPHDNRFEYLRALVPACSIGLYYRLQYEPKGSSLLGINSIHHAWKRSRFTKVLQSTDPRESSLKAETES